MRQQFIFKLQELPSSGREWSLQIPRSLFEDAGFGSVEPPQQLCQDVTWHGNISLRGELFELSGEWQLTLIRQCVRCNVEFPWQLDGALSRCFQLGSDAGESDDGESCDSLQPPGLVNLVDLIREELWLAWKPMVVCSESCKGLCQQCGKNLNEGECNCSQKDDNHPFAILSKIRFDT